MLARSSASPRSDVNVGGFGGGRLDGARDDLTGNIDGSTGTDVDDDVADVFAFHDVLQLGRPVQVPGDCPCRLPALQPARDLRQWHVQPDNRYRRARHCRLVLARLPAGFDDVREDDAGNAFLTK